MCKVLTNYVFKIKLRWFLRKKKCVNCRFLKKVDTSDNGQRRLPEVKCDDRQRIWLSEWQEVRRHLECHYNIWINKTHDKEFLKSFKCRHYLPYKKYSYATFPALEQLLQQDAEKWKWCLMFFTSLFAAIAACVSAGLHTRIIGFIGGTILWGYLTL